MGTESVRRFPQKIQRSSEVFVKRVPRVGCDSVVVTAMKLGATGMAGLFAGAAMYVNLADHPSSVMLDTVSYRRHWMEAYNRAKKFQGGMALVGALAGTCACYLDDKSDHRYLWLVGSGILFSVWPFTLFVMMPDIKKLLQDDVIETAGETWVRDHIARWNKLHMFRTVVSFTAFGIFLYGLSRR